MSHRVTELHNIMPIVNILSVLSNGILSYSEAAKLPHCSVAMSEVQERRDMNQVPRGLKLHQYANLYFHARNPMMYKRKAEAENLCILRISKEVLNMDGVVLSDQNASTGFVRFLAPADIDCIDFDMVFAENWYHHVQIIYWRQKAAKCAEVLIPGRVPATLIIGAYVVNKSCCEKLRSLGFTGEISEEPYLFFSGASNG